MGQVKVIDREPVERDVHLRYAKELVERLDRGEGNTVRFDPRAFRAPRDRSDVIASIMHESICRTGGCDASGGHSSLSYDATFDEGAHYAWVAAWPQIRAELESLAEVIPGDLEYHTAIARDDAETPLRLGPKRSAAALALVLHSHCDESALMPAGCRDPEGPLCDEAVRAGVVVADWMRRSRVAFWRAGQADLVMTEGLLENARARHKLFWRTSDEARAKGLSFDEQTSLSLAAAYGDQTDPPEASEA